VRTNSNAYTPNAGAEPEAVDDADAGVDLDAVEVPIDEIFHL
jgi:hypothetical protein